MNDAGADVLSTVNNIRLPARQTAEMPLARVNSFPYF
jgi:hypothetical protein